MSDDIAARVKAAVIAAWSADDPGIRVDMARLPGGLIDMTVVTKLFAGHRTNVRERMLWDVLRPFPAADMLHMSYSLLLTPEEAETCLDPSDPIYHDDPRKDPH